MSLVTQSQPRTRFRQFTERDDQFGKNMGDTLLFDKVFNVKTAGGKLTEGVPVPMTNISFRQGSVVADEYGNGIRWTSKLETLSQFNVDDPIQNALINDNVKTVDKEVYKQFANSMVKYIPTGTPGTPTATWDTSPSLSGGVRVTATSATRDIQLWDIKNIVDALKQGVYGAAVGSPIEPYDGRDYLGLVGVDFARAVSDDPTFNDYKKYGDPERLWNGEVGRVEKVRFIEEVHQLGTLGTSGFKGEGFIFGKQTVKEIRVVPDEIRRGIPGDFDREKGMIWYLIAGFKLIWDFDATNEPMAPVVHITSA